MFNHLKDPIVIPSPRIETALESINDAKLKAKLQDDYQPGILSKRSQAISEIPIKKSS